MAYINNLDQVQPGLIVTTWRESGYYRIVGIWEDPSNDRREGINKLVRLEKLASSGGKMMKKPSSRIYAASTLYIYPRDSVLRKAERELEKWSNFLNTMSGERYGE